jgi:hypothetical protein
MTGSSMRWCGAAMAIIFSMILGTCAVTRPSPIVAQAGEGDYNGVDVVFLVDQSGSMGGKAYGSDDHPAANDPNDLRFSGLQELVERLAYYRMTYFHDSEVQFQVAVIYFGSDYQRMLDPTVVDPDTPGEWGPLAQEIRSRLGAETFQKNLGNTDHLDALKAAKGTLDEMAKSWQEGGKHLQAILMLTDGESFVACPEPSAGTETPTLAPAFCRNGDFEWGIYAGLLTDYVEEKLSNPPVLIYVAAINDRNREYWSKIRRFWEALTHQHAKLVDATTMWEFFEGMLADLTVNDPNLSAKKTTPGEVVEIPETEDKVPVPPYLQEITFTIHKPAPGVRVQLFQDNVNLEDMPSTMVEGKDAFIERITIPKPQPGYITLVRPKASILRIFMIKVGADVRCDEVATVPQFIPLRLRCIISSRYGSLPPYSEALYRLNVEAEVQGEGQSQRIPLNPQGDSTYSAFFLPTQVGTFSFNIVARTKDPTGEDFELFRKPPAGMATFTVEATTPRLETEATPVALIPVVVAVRMVDPQGTDLYVSEEAAPYVQIEATFEGGDTTKKVSLVRGETGFQGTFTPLKPGTYQVYLHGEVKDPMTGQRFNAFDQSLGSVEVAPPRAMWDGFTNPWPQYQPAKVSFFLADPAGKPVSTRLDPTFTLHAQAEIRDGRGQPVAVALTESDRGRWTGTYIPQEEGNLTIYVTVSAQEPGEAQEVGLVENLPLFRFSVRPMSLVQPEVRTPRPEARHAWRDILWRVRPLKVEAALVDKDGNVLRPADVQKNPGQMPFSVQIVRPGTATGKPLFLTQGSAPGFFSAMFDDFGPFQWYAQRDLGWYEVQLSQLADLKETYTYGGVTSESVRVFVGRHDQWWVLPLVLTAILGVILAVALRKTYLHLWSAVGTLAIEGTSWRVRLRDYGMHSVTFTSRHALPTGIQKIVVAQPLGQKTPQIAVQLKGGGWAFRQIVSSGFRQPAAGKYVTYSVGAGERAASGIAPDRWATLFGLLSVVILAGLLVVALAIISSLG